MNRNLNLKYLVIMLAILPVIFASVNAQADQDADIAAALTQLKAQINNLRTQIQASSNQMAHQYFERAEELAVEAESEYRAGNFDNAGRLIDRSREYLQKAEAELRRPNPNEGDVKERLSREIVRLRDRLQATQNTFHDYLFPSVQVLLERAQEDLAEATRHWREGTSDGYTRASQMILRANQLITDAANLALTGQNRFGEIDNSSLGSNMAELSQEWSRLHRQAVHALAWSENSNAQSIFDNAVLLVNNSEGTLGANRASIDQILRSIELLKLVIRMTGGEVDTTNLSNRDRAFHELERLRELLSEAERRLENHTSSTGTNYINEALELLEQAEASFEEGRYNQVFLLLQSSGRLAIRALNIINSNTNPVEIDNSDNISKILKDFNSKILPETKSYLEKNSAGENAWKIYERAEKLGQEAQSQFNRGNPDKALRLIQAARIYTQQARIK